MLDSEQPGSASSTSDPADSTAGPAQGVGTAATPPVVTRTTRGASGRRAATKKSPAAGAPATSSGPDTATDTVTQAASDSTTEPEKKPVAKRAPAKKAAAKAAAKKTPSKTAATKSAATKSAAATKTAATRKTAAKKASEQPATAIEGTLESSQESPVDSVPTTPAKKAVVRKTASRRTATKKSVTPTAVPQEATETTAETPPVTPEKTDAVTDQSTAVASGHAVLFQTPTATTTRRTRKKAVAPPVADEPQVADIPLAETQTTGSQGSQAPGAEDESSQSSGAEVAPTAKKTTGRRSAAKKAVVESPATPPGETTGPDSSGGDGDGDGPSDTDAPSDTDEDDGEGGATRRRRRRGGRRRRKVGDSVGGDDTGDSSGSDDDSDSSETTEGVSDESADESGDSTGEGTSRRRRRRRRAGDDSAQDSDDEPNTVTRVRKTRTGDDQITAVAGSTRLEAKKQRRREGREAGRRRAPIVSEAEFLARREAVERVMVIRQRKDLTQIAVLEDKVLVEHYVARESQTSLIGNVYLGRVQNVLPSMEAAFIDIGKGRNAVLYAGEVNWSSLGHKEGQVRKIESVLSSGQMILVQVTKDPIGHKGARLTSQVSLAGRFLVYVPDGTTSGISRKLPDTERNRLKTLLKEIVPDSAGVIVRTAAEGASEEELTSDVERLKSRWEDIEKKSGHKGSGPQMLYGEPDLTLKVVRDLFTEDFVKLVIEGDDAWDTVRGYVEQVAPDLAERVEKFERAANGPDIFATHRINEQIHKGLDRKVFLPSGGSLIIDRTEAMTVVDVNTGKFTGSGGNLEETVTKNNLEAAEEIVRQLRLRDIGGIIVVDFIDMVMESNRDLVVRRLVECLGRDRTRHQVAEVTSLGLVQMTRKRIGTGLLEVFSENCEHCQGRGVVIKDQPVDSGSLDDSDSKRSGSGSSSGRRRGRRGANGEDSSDSSEQNAPAPSPKDVAAMARNDRPDDDPVEGSTRTAIPTDIPTDTDTDTATVTTTDEAVADAPVKRVTRRTRGRAGGRAAPDRVESRTVDPAETDGVDVAAVAKGADEVAAKPEVVEPETAQPTQEMSEPEPVSSEPAKASEPVPSKVVTRTRRRAASRPAGPPAGTAEPQDALIVGAVAADATDSTETEPAAVVVTRVRAKKSGARKR